MEVSNGTEIVAARLKKVCTELVSKTIFLRYELLLRDYIKRLPDTHDDKQPACDAQRIIQEANQRNNLKKAEAEKHGKLASLAKSISGLNDVVDGRRNLVFHGNCLKLGKKNSVRNGNFRQVAK